MSVDLVYQAYASCVKDAFQGFRVPPPPKFSLDKEPKQVKEEIETYYELLLLVVNNKDRKTHFGSVQTFYNWFYSRWGQYCKRIVRIESTTMLELVDQRIKPDF